ncbi:hypothetical protein Scep_011856 [Stephania cephalantha]|uniref:Uncharacterized protein n=1 Tax=Stephania cephalantha TaxID=152367 RepID=A0AAP0JE55_9MAGN
MGDHTERCGSNVYAWVYLLVYVASKKAVEEEGGLVPPNQPEPDILKDDCRQLLDHFKWMWEIRKSSHLNLESHDLTKTATKCEVLHSRQDVLQASKAGNVDSRVNDVRFDSETEKIRSLLSPLRIKLNLLREVRDRANTYVIIQVFSMNHDDIRASWSFSGDKGKDKLFDYRGEGFSMLSPICDNFMSSKWMSMTTPSDVVEVRDPNIDYCAGPIRRFSNGLTSIDVIAARGSVILTRVTYASAAAGIRDETGQQLGTRVSFSGQQRNFQNTAAQMSSLLGGQNAVTNYLGRFPALRALTTRLSGPTTIAPRFGTITHRSLLEIEVQTLIFRLKEIV